MAGDVRTRSTEAGRPHGPSEHADDARSGRKGFRSVRERMRLGEAPDFILSEIAGARDVPSSQAGRTPLALRVFGILSIVVGTAVVVPLAFFILRAFVRFALGRFETWSTVTLVVVIVNLVSAAVLIGMFVLLGVRLLRSKRRLAAELAYAMTGVDFVVAASYVMLLGMDWIALFLVGVALFLVTLSSYMDPSLAQERELQRRLRDMDARSQAEEGTIGRDETGRGYIALNFINLFWIFTICSVVGLGLETVYHLALYGEWQDRAATVFGPFSIIYGVGAVLITIALNRFYRKNPLIIFLVAAVIGGAFEFSVSWLMQMAFGITSWDYTGTFLSIGGRTNGFYMTMWGLLGLAWVKLALPRILRLINRIPWNWRYAATSLCAAVMIVDCGLTLVALDSWFNRLAGIQTNTEIERFCDDRFDDAFMEHRFQTMAIDPETAVRGD